MKSPIIPSSTSTANHWIRHTDLGTNTRKGIKASDNLSVIINLALTENNMKEKDFMIKLEKSAAIER